MPPDPAVLRKIVTKSRSSLPGGLAVSNAVAAEIGAPWSKKLQLAIPYPWKLSARRVIRKAGYPSVVGLAIQAPWLGGSYGISFWKKMTVPSFPFQITSYFS